MTWQEFTPQIKDLIAAYPSFRPENKGEVAKAYFGILARFSVASVRRAIREARHAEPNFFPSGPALEGLCEQAEASAISSRRLEAKFEPQDHGCELNGAVKVSIDSALKLVYLVCPYEAIHVRCPGAPQPICPVCGVAQPPSINALIAYLMQSPVYKAQTQGWNAHHKGLLVCPACERSFSSAA